MTFARHKKAFHGRAGCERMRTLLPLLAIVLLAPAASAQLPELGDGSPADSLGDPERVEAELRALADEHPDLVKFSVLGSSVAGNDLWRLDIANFSDPAWESKPALLVDGGHHGNEFSGIHTARFFAVALVDEAAANASVLSGKRVIVVPVVNPDGWVAAQRTNANGVNLNRNYPFHWNDRGTDPVPYGANYAGPSAGSEPETKLVMAAMESVDLRAYVSYHCCGPEPGGEIVLPWDPEADMPIPDWGVYERFLALARSSGVEKHRAPSGLGESISWAYGVRGAISVLPETPMAANPRQDDDARREELREMLSVPRLALAHLEDLGARLVVTAGPEGFVVVRNEGWGPAVNLSAGGTVVPLLAPGASAQLPSVDCGKVAYERLALAVAGRGAVAKLATCEPSSTGASAIPGAAAGVALVALALVAAARRYR